MSLRSLCLVVALVACGGGSTQTGPDEPQTAREKQLKEAQASGELDKPNSKWGNWRYQGDRKQCFFVVGRRCYKTENAACAAAHCKSPKRCDVVGGGPAQLSCK
jgi:hypothetical protein